MFKTGDRIGPLEVQQQIGQGGMATVYKVWHHELHRHEALKLPHSQNVQDEQGRRFIAEVRHTANFSHPHIATIHNVCTGDLQYFTMEYVGDGDLADIIHQRGQLSLEETCSLLGQVASALDYAHAKGVLHRDVKPGNILLNRKTDGEYDAKVVDFGISRAKDLEAGARLTKDGMFIGTPEYMSPEQAGSGAVVDGHTDQYSLGVIAYEMLCGEPPFKADGDTSYLSVVIKHARDEPQALCERVASLPQPAGDVVMRALSKEPAQRFSSCSEFIAALVATIPPVIVASPPVEVEKKKDFWESALLRTLLLSVAGVGVILILFGTVFKGQEQSLPKPPLVGRGPTVIPTASPKPTVTPASSPIPISQPQPVKGTYTFNDGATYSGDLLNGKPHGIGIKTQSDKRQIEAEWVKGKSIRLIRELPYNGVLKRSDSTYHGQMLAGKMNGKGKLTRAAGLVLTGQFKENRPVGEITLKYKKQKPETLSPWTLEGEQEVWKRWKPRGQSRQGSGNSANNGGRDGNNKEGNTGNSGQKQDSNNGGTYKPPGGTGTPQKPEASVPPIS